MPRRLVVLLGLLLAVAAVAGCATVPTATPVEVLRRISEGEGRVLPPGPVADVNPLDLVRGFVNASGSSEDRHAAARRFLAPSATWDDAASLTVIEEQFDTVFAVPPGDTDTAVVRVRGTQLGRLTAAGAFEQDERPVEIDVRVARQDGQWRITDPPPGVIVRLPDFQAAYRSVRTFFVDPARKIPVADLRYLPANPPRAQPSRAIDYLLAGPSDALAGAATSAIPATARLRSNVMQTPDGAVVVDFTELGELDEGQRRMIAAQVVFSLAEVSVPRVRLLDDGAPLLADRPDLTRESFAELISDDQPRGDVPGVVVVNGRARALVESELGPPLPGPAGSGAFALDSVSVSSDGERIAAVNRVSPQRLLIGPLRGPLRPIGVQASSITRPSWTSGAGEVWTVLDSERVVRLVLGQAGEVRVEPVDASALTALGPIADLRMSRDGIRVAAVVGGQLAVGAVARSASGQASILNVSVLRATELTGLTAVDWRASDQIAVAGQRPDRAVALASVDGLNWQSMPTQNLTPPLSSIAASPGRPLLVTDLTGVWSFGADDQGSWRQLVGGAPSAVASYPG